MSPEPGHIERLLLVANVALGVGITSLLSAASAYQWLSDNSPSARVALWVGVSGQKAAIYGARFAASWANSRSSLRFSAVNWRAKSRQTPMVLHRGFRLYIYALHNTYLGTESNVGAGRDLTERSRDNLPCFQDLTILRCKS